MATRIQIWAAEKNYLIKYLEAINQGPPTETQAALFDDPASAAKSPILSVNENTAAITIKGMLVNTKLHPFIAALFGIQETSFSEIQEAIAEVKNNEAIETVRLIMNTGGGEVQGTDETSRAVAALAKVKTVIAENHGLIASAGYWIASAASKIIAGSPVNLTGSIGVIATGLDNSKALENRGLQRVVIISENAPNKAGFLTEAGRADILERINAMERVFFKRVSEGRGVGINHIKEVFGRGGLLIAQDPDKKEHDALSVGMIDEVTSGFTSEDSSAESQAADGGGCGGGT
jgi:ClpP class serine protease